VVRVIDCVSSQQGSVDGSVSQAQHSATGAARESIVVGAGSLAVPLSTRGGPWQPTATPRPITERVEVQNERFGDTAVPPMSDAA